MCKEHNAAWAIPLIVPLWLTYVSNQWSRYSINYLVDFRSSATAYTALNVDLALDESRYAFLASAAFTSLFAVASLGAGIVCDRFNRKTLLVVATGAWSLATLGEAESQNFEQLALWRVVMGLASAFTTPTAYTLISDFVPSSRQSMANSIYGTGVAIASGLSSLTILLDDEVGWRTALQLVATFGCCAAAAAFMWLPSDDRTTKNLSSKTVDANLKNSLKASGLVDLLLEPRMRWLYLASFLRFCSGLCIGVWSAPFFRLAFPDSQSFYSVAQAGISVGCASVSGVLGGYVTDRLMESTLKRDGSETTTLDSVKLFIPVIGSLLAAPFWYLAVQTDQTFESSMVWLAAEYLVAECWFGPTISFLQSSISKGSGGSAQGIFTLTGALANAAPSAVGFLYSQNLENGLDQVVPVSSLSHLLSVVVSSCYLLSAGCFVLAARSRTIR